MASEPGSSSREASPAGSNSPSDKLLAGIRAVARFGDSRGRALAWLVVLLLAAILSLTLGFPRVTLHRSIRAADIHADTGYAFVYPIRIRGSDASNGTAELELLEDGKPLPLPHTAHVEIRREGRGRFSHWRQGILFSSSDGTDPRSNGRAYEIRYRFPPRLVLTFVQPLVLVLVLAAYLLHANRLRRHARARDLVCAALAGTVVAAAIAARIVWTSAIPGPASTPDSIQYLDPALRHPAFPISEMRPIVYPWVIAASHALFGSGKGLLVSHNGIAVVSAVLLVGAAWLRLRMRFAAVLLLVYLLFAEKNVAFEYLLLSEHLSRALYVLFVAALLYFWRRRSAASDAAIGLLVVANILSKQSAVVLVPVFLLWLGLQVAPAPGLRWRKAARAAGIFLATILLGLLPYAAAMKQRYGYFQLSSLTGHSLFWQMNQLLVVERGAYPEIKAEMRPFYSIYRDKYVRRGINLGDWAVWGAPRAELKDDFGSWSPARAVRRYAIGHGEGSLFHRIDRIYLDLSREAIRAHPLEYLALSLRSADELVREGFIFGYMFKPVRARSGSSPWLIESIEGESVRACDAFGWLAVLSLPLLAVAVVLRRRFAEIGDRLRLLIVPAGFVVLYVAFVAFLSPAEPPRYLLPVQDMMLLVPLAVWSIGARTTELAAGSTSSSRSGEPARAAGSPIPRETC